MLTRKNSPPMEALALFWMLGQVGCLGAQPTSSLPEHLGLKPPGRVPEVFAPGIISGAGHRLHGSVVISPDTRVILWSVLPPAVMSVSIEDGTWSDAEPLELEGGGVQAPAFSPDGTRLYYQAVVEGGAGSLDIWWVPKEEDGWGSTESAGPAVNTENLESQPSLTGDGTLYLTGTREGTGFNRGIFRSRLQDGVYTRPELLGGGINSESMDYCPWVALDESFLLFASSRPQAEEHLFLHVSFRQEDGSWSRPENIHPAIGFQKEARFPSLSPDGRYLFFVAGDSAYWVDIAPVMELRPGSRNEGR